MCVLNCKPQQNGTVSRTKFKESEKKVLREKIYVKGDARVTEIVQYD